VTRLRVVQWTTGKVAAEGVTAYFLSKPSYASKSKSSSSPSLLP
jgi:hypothetical protein